MAPVASPVRSMSSSRESYREQRYQSRRRPRRSGVPMEIATTSPVPSAAATSSSAPDESKYSTKSSSSEFLWRVPPRVQILSGHQLMPHDEPWLYPPEPTEPPPLPSEIIQLLVVGASQSGKTSIVRRFAERRNTHNSKESREMKEPVKAKKESAWSVEYSKKDVSFWQTPNHLSDEPCCARVQLWDVTGGGPVETDERSLERRQEWIKLVDKASAVVLVASVENGSAALLQTIRTWKRWLDANCPSDDSPPVVLLAHKSDLLSLHSLDPSVWVNLGSEIAQVCQRCGITNWQITSCTGDSFSESSVDDALMGIIRDSVKQIPGSIRKHARGKTKGKTPILEAKAVPVASWLT